MGLFGPKRRKPGRRRGNPLDREKLFEVRHRRYAAAELRDLLAKDPKRRREFILDTLGIRLGPRQEADIDGLILREVMLEDPEVAELLHSAELEAMRKALSPTALEAELDRMIAERMKTDPDYKKRMLEARGRRRSAHQDDDTPRPSWPRRGWGVRRR